MSHQIKTHKLLFVSFLSLFLEILVMIVSINLIKNRLKKSLEKRLTIDVYKRQLAIFTKGVMISYIISMALLTSSIEL